ncbi:hypothetical protein [Methylobacterium sp. J-068]|uniref:hypothetical protein n=1 Tax=Methylobacterium sp. J-068 TaxID=2836649 RepID=UPI001FB98021|nr:hypothetical protein [Methylobacterium sp. J-068]MCJ2035761.1 hypothetical protein [Methylobacterium sp. J-068]
MTPETYVTTIVVPTLKEALAARGDRRLIYLACIAVFHVIDYVAEGDEGRTKKLQNEIKARDSVAFDLLHRACNGAKHAGGKGQKWMVPGTEREARPFGFGPECGGLDDGRWDHAGLAVTHDGQEHFLDVPAQRLLLIICQHCATEIGPVDLSFLDPDVLASAQP